MPLSNLLRSAAGTCPFCHQKASIISREHPECRQTFQAGWTEMIQLAADADRTRSFDEKSLRLSLVDTSPSAPMGTATPSTKTLEEG